MKKVIAKVTCVFVFCSFFSFSIADAAPRKGKSLARVKMVRVMVKGNTSKSRGSEAEIVASEGDQVRELRIQIKELKTKMKGLKNQLKSSKLQSKKMERKIDRIVQIIVAQLEDQSGQGDGEDPENESIPEGLYT